MKKQVIEDWRAAIAASEAADLAPTMTLRATTASAANYASASGRINLATWMPRSLAEQCAAMTGPIRWTSENAMTGAQSPAITVVREYMGSVPAHLRSVARVMSKAQSADELATAMIIAGSIMLNFVPGMMRFKSAAFEWNEPSSIGIEDYPGINWTVPNIHYWCGEELRTMGAMEAIVHGWTLTLKEWVVVKYEPHLDTPDGPRPLSLDEIGHAWADRARQRRAKRMAKRSERSTAA